LPIISNSVAHDITCTGTGNEKSIVVLGRNDAVFIIYSQFTVIVVEPTRIWQSTIHASYILLEYVQHTQLLDEFWQCDH